MITVTFKVDISQITPVITREQLEEAIRSILSAPIELENGDLLYQWYENLHVEEKK